jgi:hypothetical protein
MPRRLSPPPAAAASDEQKQRWMDEAWRFMQPQIATSGDAAATISSNTTYHGVTALSAGRTLTLPDSSDMLDGQEIIVQDESGAAGTYNITIASSGSDTVNGGSSVSIAANYGRRRIIKHGAGKFYSA